VRCGYGGAKICGPKNNTSKGGRRQEKRGREEIGAQPQEDDAQEERGEEIQPEDGRQKKKR